MCSSGTGSPPVAKDDELPENPIGEEEESLERNSTEENDSRERERERDSLRRRFAYGLHPPPPSSTSLSAALAHRSRLFLRLFAPRLRCFSGKMCSSGTGSPENPIGEEEESLELNSTEENDSGDEAASAANPMTSDAAQILPLLQNLLLNNDIQRERLTGLFQLYAPAAEDTNANVDTEDEQTEREAALSSQVHFLEQSVQMLEEELENQKKLNAQLEEQIKRLTTTSSDPERQD